MPSPWPLRGSSVSVGRSKTLLGGSWVAISRVISPLIRVISGVISPLSKVISMVTLLITTHEAPSKL